MVTTSNATRTLVTAAANARLRLLAGLGTLAVAVSYVFNPTAYRIDLEVYRAGGRAWLDGVPLYAQAFPTQIGNPLSFTYPPISAVLLSPLAWVPLAVASAVWAVLTLALFVLTLGVLARVSGVRPMSTTWWWLVVAAFAATARLEPVRATMGYGQVNVLIMALVAVDCLSPRTVWPRGLLVGLVAAFKLTPAVFVLYFLVRRDYRSAAVAAATGVAVTALGFVLAPSDSVEYWFRNLLDTGSIGALSYTSNQNLRGVLARTPALESVATPAWILLTVVVLVVGWVAMRRANKAGMSALVLVLNGVIGLLVSPVSWSHHWVWAAPALLLLGLVTLSSRSRAAAGLGVVGLVVFAIAPHWRLPNGTDGRAELRWALWQDVVGNSYVWWGLTLLVVCACTAHRWRLPVHDGAPTDGAPTDGAPTDGAPTSGAQTDGARRAGVPRGSGEHP